MGTFATTTALNTLMPGINFDTATTSLADRCVAWAESWVRGTLSKRYDVSAAPFTTYTSTSHLTCMTEELAMGYLYRHLSRGGKESLSRGDAMVKSAQDAIGAIAAFNADLLDIAGTAPVATKSTATQILHSASSYHTTFDEDDPLDWSVDDDKLTDIANGRL